MVAKAEGKVSGLRSGLWLPLFDELADPAVVARLAAEAEDAGWHGVFVWDHLRWAGPVRYVADPWITLTAISIATEAICLGPMITPLARRRPAKVARETVTLDRLSHGRFVLGVGLGDDRFGSELSSTGEEPSDRLRARMLDESLDILAAAWSGNPVRYSGEHYTVDDFEFQPPPYRREGIPVWVGGLAGRTKPQQRAARHDGYVPVNLMHPDQLAEAVVAIDDARSHAGTTPYDIVAALPPETDPQPFAKAGATWWLPEFDPETLTLDLVRGVIRGGPASP
ncbi:LLM class flavin-dependent oxidoreductase [Salinibacterium sp. M195]|uniref:LLM class flavin-dependent oxidoreductase n=1 Tax=Salinibacterium sp. M195 TaxID=2583374 RepID=UPI002103E2CB|nr:LLM class flavin-dependent oxidoreductase [Salinibacterium sp. M195]